jgi:hypothetical protein
MAATTPPNQTGRGLVNLVSELEQRLIGSAPSVGLESDLARSIPGAATFVFVLFDGLGADQLDRSEARELARSFVGPIDAPFPTTTTVSLATIATGMSPARHGLLAHALRIPALGTTVNTIHMRTVWGGEVEVPLETFLPAPTLWQRLSGAGVEAVVVQPGNFTDTSLTKVLYGGARFEGYYSLEEAVTVTVDVASHPGRFVFLYVPFVDLAAHMHGQASREYAEALSFADTIWGRLCTSLHPDVVMVGTADHGHTDIARDRRVRLTEEDEYNLHLYGDSRALFVIGDPGRILDRVPGVWIPRSDLSPFWGAKPVDPLYSDRLPDGILFPDPGWAVFARYMNDRLVGYHGGLTDPERSIPVLLR